MASREVQVRMRTLDGYLPPAAREALLRRTATLAIGRIKRRTGQGKDVEGAAFKPYSARYAKQRTATGRNASPVTLLLSGHMLGSMTILEADARRVLIGFTGSSAAMKFAYARRTVRVKQGVMGTAKTKVFDKSKRAFMEMQHTIPNAAKAYWNDKGMGHNPRRHFFGLSKQDRLELTRDAIKQLIELARAESHRQLPAAGALRAARRRPR